MKRSAVILALLALGVFFQPGCENDDSLSGYEQALPVGPDISGSWHGRYYIDDDPGVSTLITAEVIHAGSTVIIVTSKTGEGSVFEGSIDATGHMGLIDFDDGEKWTTFFGPASAGSLVVADYLWDDDLGNDSPLAIIELVR